MHREVGFDFDVWLDCVGSTVIGPRYGLTTVAEQAIKWRLCGNSDNEKEAIFRRIEEAVFQRNCGH